MQRRVTTLPLIRDGSSAGSVKRSKSENKLVGERSPMSEAKSKQTPINSLASVAQKDMTFSKRMISPKFVKIADLKRS